MNLYAYVGNDPLNAIDPTGERVISCTVTQGQDGEITATCREGGSFPFITVIETRVYGPSGYRGTQTNFYFGNLTAQQAFARQTESITPQTHEAQMPGELGRCNGDGEEVLERPRGAVDSIRSSSAISGRELPMSTPSIRIQATCMIPMANGLEISMSPTRAMSPVKISVGLFVRGENLDPDHVTARLGASPTIKQIKGETRAAPDGRQVHAKEGLWARVFDVDDVAEIDRLLAAVSSGSLTLAGIANVTDAYFDVFIANESDEGRADLAFDIGAATLAAIGGTGLPLRMTLAFMPG